MARVPKKRVERRGYVLLGQSMARAAVSQYRLSIDVGVTRQAVSQWLSGRATPDLKHLVYLQARFGVPVESWLGIAAVCA